MLHWESVLVCQLLPIFLVDLLASTNASRMMSTKVLLASYQFYTLTCITATRSRFIWKFQTSGNSLESPSLQQLVPYAIWLDRLHTRSTITLSILTFSGILLIGIQYHDLSFFSMFPVFCIESVTSRVLSRAVGIFKEREKNVLESGSRFGTK